MPEIKFPAVKLPEIKLPQVKLPEAKLPEVDLSIMTASTGGHRALIGIDGANLETPPLEHLRVDPPHTSGNSEMFGVAGGQSTVTGR